MVLTFFIFFHVTASNIPLILGIATRANPTPSHHAKLYTNPAITGLYGVLVVEKMR